MKRTSLVLLLLAVFASASLSAQTFSLITGHEPVTSLDGLWRFHTGDNPAWADPNYDDSNWPLIRSGESWTEQGYPAFTGYAWYRFKVEVPGDGQPVDLLLTDILNGCQVYANGKLIGSAGSAVATRDPIWSSLWTMFRLPVSGKGAQTIQIALRVWTYRPLASWVGAGSLSPGSEAGDPNLLFHLLESQQSTRALHFVNEYAFGLFAALVGFAILALFLLRLKEKEYLCFSILLLAQSASVALDLQFNLGSLPYPLWYLLDLVTEVPAVIAALAFFSIVLRVRRSILWWTVLLLSAACPFSAVLLYLQWASASMSYALEGVCIAPAYAWVISVLLTGVFRKEVSARLLLVPVALFYGLDLFDLTARIVWQLTGSMKLALSAIYATLISLPFPISLDDLVGFVFILALLIFLVRRFALARKEEERLAGEFEAAKTVQSLLIPAVPPATPGFMVECVYLPAQEVGGDFFQILPGDDGALLIVVGDVSGKGLKAAMTVSAIVGALRAGKARQPVQVLAHLNRVLCGQIGGFVTCCAALIDADGKLTIANAGHLSPYRNGEELPVPTSLPLGLLADASYEEKRFELAPGDRLTFLSDGVVEARNSAGELFGFDRTAALSTRTAESIASAAQAFGQDDDITVLTLAFAGAEAPHA
ncbi:MAG: SpoIIE family protein phosphatase [Terracidiphilus sp.]|jgi:hypothetical protein